jgi:hypothetical protein
LAELERSDDDLMGDDMIPPQEHRRDIPSAAAMATMEAIFAPPLQKCQTAMIT